MTYEQFIQQYPYDTRKECTKAIAEQRINGWAQGRTAHGETRFRVHVIVDKPVPKKQAGKRRITAASICADIYAKMENEDGEVDRTEFVERAVSKGINKVTAQTRYGYLVKGESK